LEDRPTSFEEEKLELEPELELRAAPPPDPLGS
jgi:hypothetical protein